MKKLFAACFAFVVACGLSASAADAKANWTKHCAKCHGADGKGKTKMGEKFGAKDYTDAKVQASFKDEDMFKATKQGVKDKAGKNAMPGYADKLTDEEIKALVQHVRSFKK